MIVYQVDFPLLPLAFKTIIKNMPITIYSPTSANKAGSIKITTNSKLSGSFILYPTANYSFTSTQYTTNNRLSSIIASGVLATDITSHKISLSSNSVTLSSAININNKLVVDIDQTTGIFNISSNTPGVYAFNYYASTSAVSVSATVAVNVLSAKNIITPSWDLSREICITGLIPNATIAQSIFKLTFFKKIYSEFDTILAQYNNANSNFALILSKNFNESNYNWKIVYRNFTGYGNPTIFSFLSSTNIYSTADILSATPSQWKARPLSFINGANSTTQSQLLSNTIYTTKSLLPIINNVIDQYVTTSTTPFVYQISASNMTEQFTQTIPLSSRYGIVGLNDAQTLSLAISGIFVDPSTGLVFSSNAATVGTTSVVLVAKNDYGTSLKKINIIIEPVSTIDYRSQSLSLYSGYKYIDISTSKNTITSFGGSYQQFIGFTNLGSQAAEGIVNLNGQVTFKYIETSTAGNISYQWLCNGIAIINATTTSLIIQATYENIAINSYVLQINTGGIITTWEFNVEALVLPTISDNKLTYYDNTTLSKKLYINGILPATNYTESSLLNDPTNPWPTQSTVQFGNSSTTLGIITFFNPLSPINVNIKPNTTDYNNYGYTVKQAQLLYAYNGSRNITIDSIAYELFYATDKNWHLNYIDLNSGAITTWVTSNNSTKSLPYNQVWTCLTAPSLTVPTIVKTTAATNQWYKDNKVIVSATSAIYNIANATSKDTGTYTLLHNLKPNRAIKSYVIYPFNVTTDTIPSILFDNLYAPSYKRFIPATVPVSHIISYNVIDPIIHNISQNTLSAINNRRYASNVKFSSIAYDNIGLISSLNNSISLTSEVTTLITKPASDLHFINCTLSNYTNLNKRYIVDAYSITSSVYPVTGFVGPIPLSVEPVQYISPFIRRFDSPIAFGPTNVLCYWGVVAQEDQLVNRRLVNWYDPEAIYLYVNSSDSITVPLTGWKCAKGPKLLTLSKLDTSNIMLSGFYSSNYHKLKYPTLAQTSLLSANINMQVVYGLSDRIPSTNTLTVSELYTDVDISIQSKPFEYTNIPIQTSKYTHFTIQNNSIIFEQNLDFTLPINIDSNDADNSELQNSLLETINKTGVQLTYIAKVGNRYWVAEKPVIGDGTVVLTLAGSPYQSASGLAINWDMPGGNPAILGNKTSIGTFGSLSSNCFWAIKEQSFPIPSYSFVNTLSCDVIGSFGIPSTNWQNSYTNLTVTSERYTLPLSSTTLPIELYYGVKVNNSSEGIPGTALIIKGDIIGSDFFDINYYIKQSTKYSLAYVAYNPTIPYGNKYYFGDEQVRRLVALGYL